jgi:hypothetical protein
MRPKPQKPPAKKIKRKPVFRRPGKWAAVGFTAALALAGASRAHAQPVALEKPDLVLYKMQYDAPDKFLRNAIDARTRIKIKSAMTLAQKKMALEEGLNDMQKAYLNALVRRELENNPEMQRLNQRMERMSQKERETRLALYVLGAATPALILGGYMLGHRRGRRTKPQSFGWSGLQ